MIIHGWATDDSAAAVELLMGRLDYIRSGRPIELLSAEEKAGFIILTKATMSLLNPFDMETLLRGAHLVDEIGLSMWRPQH